MVNFVTVVLIFYLPESPKWLYANARYNEARDGLQIVAKMNQRKINTNRLAFDNEVDKRQESEFDESQTTIENSFVRIVNDDIVLRGSIWELVTIWQIRRNFFCITVLLSSSAFCFFLINFQMKFVKGSLITNTLFS